MTTETDLIRNIALVGHQGNGKTTLAEAMLYRAGVVTRPGRVEVGNTVLDTQPEEHDRTQSLALGLASFSWGDYRINLLDPPGYADFVGDAMTALRVADVAVFVIDGVSGLQVNDELLWQAAGERSIPRILFVNKMDKERASFDAVLSGIRDHFGSGVEPVDLPVGEASAFTGVADLLTEHVILYDTGSANTSDELPADIAEREHEQHEHLVEDVVEIEDDLLSKYLDGDDISVAELEHALRAGFAGGSLWPVLCGSAVDAIAVDRLLDFVCRIAPAPSEAPGIEVRGDGVAKVRGDGVAKVRGDGVAKVRGDGVATVMCDPSGDPLAYVFKTQTDEYVGQVALVKILSGTVHADEVLVNQRTGAKERLHNLLRVLGSKHTAIDTAEAGDIVGAIKLTDVATGDTLAPIGAALTVPPIEHRRPVYGIAVAAESAGDEDKLATALAELVSDDPTLEVTRDSETHQTVVRGAGDVHVQVALTRLKRRYGITLQTEPVKIAYRETLLGPVETEGRHKKQSGGHGQFGVATVRFEPLPRDEGYDFVDETRGGVIPKSLIPAVGKGIAESMGRGGRHGFPLVDLRATVLDGKHHSVDSDDFSFRMAGALALRAAIDKVGTLVLEPVDHVEVTVPATLQGDVMADLGRRRGQIEGTEPAGDGEITVIASVPSSEITDYPVALRSMTHGRGRLALEFKCYQERPEPR
ncbi:MULTISPECIES: translation factor GTPase family protein [unclassified Rhodococcus (in: high G+C Gram-positive bacteria)]|uniref:elongation factor G n=1 Tax=unclassified Rhodococcus (in: high G+C Gram-positive bacteria) TaxID=192944 RepID=UPI00163A7ACD|nr:MULTISPECIES: elongation factor G [unclassified Rhodococcus (in: high G+C Gram-positive bacteria)]MBC2643116.1 elongation factor G [Rhodococcus sp. 3A]MBC2892143.1 elongation factor G [Rhodococcus sp. 4CII]